MISFSLLSIVVCKRRSRSWWKLEELGGVPETLDHPGCHRRTQVLRMSAAFEEIIAKRPSSAITSRNASRRISVATYARLGFRSFVSVSRISWLPVGASAAFCGR